ncbi:MAG: hypothetical protein ACXABY_25495 [Candidatus Thorarchaeota archaeon]|jgi:hypothetical protein
MTNEQFISNLFEMKEVIGKDHTKEIFVMISDHQTNDSFFAVAGDKPCKMLGEVFEFIRPEKDLEQSDSRPQL